MVYFAFTQNVLLAKPFKFLKTKANTCETSKETNIFPQREHG